MFIPIKRGTSILKMVERTSFSYETKALKSFIPMRNVILVPNDEEKGDYYVNHYLSQLKNELQFKK